MDFFNTHERWHSWRDFERNGDISTVTSILTLGTLDDAPDDGVLTFEKVVPLRERTRNVRDDFLVEARICPNYFGSHFLFNLTKTSV
jgi:hypothetical protein